MPAASPGFAHNPRLWFLALHPGTPMTERALVWFKRDLRTHDHAPLAAASACQQALGLFVVEPEWLDSPEFDAQHLAFAMACLHPLRRDLAAIGLPLQLRVGPVTAVLGQLHAAYPFTHLFSHEETGPGWSYARDLAVADWCRACGVVWTEWPQNGVVRRLKSRDGWALRWQQRMDAAPPAVPTALRGAAVDLTDWPTLQELAAAASRPQPPSRPLPAAGEAAAAVDLNSFLQRRGHSYRRDLSSPLTAAQGCSRLSAHLAFGTLSMRQVHQATEQRIARLQAAASPAERSFAYHLRGFSGRLRWHCHFMQKLEDEPTIEHRNFARTADGLREADFNPEHFEAWCQGRTGYPMVDACMRSLNATGWLNFRMRAMLVSFAAYHLWLHWRQPGLHLARQFLDFEPGIHWSQMQMQSGTTGINTLRMYSPAKQAAEHDPQGAFVRLWVPEFGTAEYPQPIVDEKLALAAAKARLYGLRKTAAANDEAEGIQHQHGSRKSGLPQPNNGSRRVKPRAEPVPSPQLDLFDG